MALNPIALCTRALLRIGAQTIAAFDEATLEAEVARNLYPSTRDALVSAYPWSFATAQVALGQLLGRPVADFAYAYQLPSDFLRALSAGGTKRGRGLNYKLADRRLLTDAPTVILTYVFRPSETVFPAFFDQVLIARLAGEFCIPLTENTSRAETLLKLAEEELTRAKLIDAQQDIPGRIEDFSLIEARG